MRFCFGSQFLRGSGARRLAVRAGIMSERVPRDCPHCGERFRKDATCNTKECSNFRASRKGLHLQDLNQRRTDWKSMNKVVKRLRGKQAFEACFAVGRIQRQAAYKASLSSPSNPRETASSQNTATSQNCESPTRLPSCDACVQMGEPTWATPPFAAKPEASQPDLQVHAASVAAEASELSRRIRAKRPTPSLEADSKFAVPGRRVRPKPGVVAATSLPSGTLRTLTSAAQGFRERRRADNDLLGLVTFPSMRAAWADLGCDYVGGIAR